MLLLWSDQELFRIEKLFIPTHSLHIKMQKFIVIYCITKMDNIPFWYRCHRILATLKPKKII